MTYKQNLHTHTVYDDGKNTPRELIETALGLGFDSLGFSGHSYMYYMPSHAMSIEHTEQYSAEVTALKAEYADRLPIFCGIEYDMYSDLDISRYDYAIGSVHYLQIDGEFVGFDRPQAEVEQVISRYFGGDGLAYAQCYYDTLSRLPDYGRFDIIGHFDLVTKHCEKRAFFDPEDKRYFRCAVQAAERLAGRIPLFEVNTGAIARGYRTTPYPSIPLLRELKRLGFGAVITSDCHQAAMLDCAYAQAEELLRYCGYREIYALTHEGFVPKAL